MPHIPVLLKEILEYANATQGGNYIDATVGAGGHTRALLSANSKTKVLGLDKDNESLSDLAGQFEKEKLSGRTFLRHASYVDAVKVAQELEFGTINGILIDLGFSSMQMDSPERGFSFQTTGPLDMRYDRNQHNSASDILNTYSEQELTTIFKEYGEEINSKKIARAVVAHRATSNLSDTSQVLDLIKKALPGPIKHKVNDVARRIFQALRIEVNAELETLTRALPLMFDLLAPGGRLMVISFHSLEDRIVKNYFASLAKGCICPPEFPECICGQNPKAKILTKKPVTASEQELVENSRSKPAKLRVAEKI